MSDRRLTSGPADHTGDGCSLATRVLNQMVPTILAVVLVLGSLDRAVSQDLSPETVEKVNSIVAATRGQSAVDQVLRQLDFPPKGEAFSPETWNGYRGWPDARKLEAAYRTANAASERSGERLLKDVLMLTARRNAAITADPVFVESVGIVEPQELETFKPGSYAFALPKAEAQTVPLPETATRVVRAVVAHTPRISGGMPALVRTCCGIASEAVFRQLQSARSYQEVVEWALRTGTLPPELQQRLAKLLEHAAKHNAALAYDKAITEFAAKAINAGFSRPLPTTIAGVDFAGVEPRVSQARQLPSDKLLTEVLEKTGKQGLPEPVALLSRTLTRAAARPDVAHGLSDFAAFQAAEYGTLPQGGAGGGEALPPRASSKPPRFSSMRVSARGFGGVVLGNEVTADPVLSKPLSFEWHAIELDSPILQELEDDDAWGYLAVYFDDGTVGVTRPMRAHHAWAATEMAYIGIDGATVAPDPSTVANGEGFGLAGFTGRSDFHFLDGERVNSVNEAARAFVIHPAAAGFQLGEDVLLADAGPFNFPEALEKQISQLLESKNPETASEQQSMLRDWLYDEDRSTYKFIDVALNIERSEDGVIYAARRPGDAGEWSLPLRREAFLTFQKFDSSGEPAAENEPQFYPLVPALVAAWPNFARLNDFAEVFAVYRWLRASDAEWLGGLEVPERGPVLSTLIVEEDQKPRLASSPFEMNLALAEEVRQLGEGIIGDGGETFRSLNDAVHDARVKRLAAQEALRLWGLETILEGDSGDSFLESRRDVAFWEGVTELEAEDLRAFLLLSGQDVEGVSASLLRSAVQSSLDEARDQFAAYQANLAETPEWQFVRSLEALEKSFAEQSPLDLPKIVIRERALGAIPEEQLAEYEKLRAQAADVEAERAMLSKVATDLAALNRSPRRRTPVQWANRSEGEELLLAWVATDAEQAQAIAMGETLTALTAEIESADTSFFRRIIARWERSSAEGEWRNLMQELGGTRAVQTVDDLNRKSEVLKEESIALEEKAAAERDRVVESLPLPGFDRWWDLQQSYRMAVFGESGE